MDAPTTDVLLHVALLSGRTAKVTAKLDASVHEVKLDVGQQLDVSVATMISADGQVLEDRWTIEDAKLQSGDTLQATTAQIRSELERQAIGLLSQLDNGTGTRDIVHQVVHINVENCIELEHLFHLILSTSLATPHFARPCAAMIFGLVQRYPELPDAQTQNNVTKTKAIRPLLKLLQNDFDKLPLGPGQYQSNFRSGWMQIFGHLNILGLIRSKITNTVLHELIGERERERDEMGPKTLPKEPQLQCACQLFELVGSFLDQDVYRLALTRLAQLSRSEMNSISVYSAETRHRIQDLIRLRVQRYSVD